MRILLLDNYGSFTYNLSQLFAKEGAEIIVRRNDKIKTNEISDLDINGICITPGPRRPEDAGISLDVVKQFSGKIPILGICLGMQVINEVYAGLTIKAPKPVHGKRSSITHDGRSVFAGIKSPVDVARYHSLQAKVTSDEIRIISRSEDNVAMAIEHETDPVIGLQFHPESFLTSSGEMYARNFITICKSWEQSQHGSTIRDICR